jgi:FHS family L-fucose permease-like MFS transporter
MFPTIFSLTLERSTASHAATSGLLCAAIGGGAILPFLAGLLADHVGLGWSFAAALAGYLYITAFAVAMARPYSETADDRATPTTLSAEP